MNFNKLMDNVNMTINTFLKKDSELFALGASEWAVAHRIAVYLEKYFKGWHIDCEYNKVGLSGTTKQNADGDYKRPDIIVHHRGMVERKHNLLVIEVKINNTQEDYAKLQDFTSPPRKDRKFQYQYGLALSFSPNLEKKWFPSDDLDKS